MLSRSYAFWHVCLLSTSYQDTQCQYVSYHWQCYHDNLLTSKRRWDHYVPACKVIILTYVINKYREGRNLKTAQVPCFSSIFTINSTFPWLGVAPNYDSWCFNRDFLSWRVRCSSVRESCSFSIFMLTIVHFTVIHISSTPGTFTKIKYILGNTNFNELQNCPAQIPLWGHTRFQLLWSWWLTAHSPSPKNCLQSAGGCLPGDLEQPTVTDWRWKSTKANPLPQSATSLRCNPHFRVPWGSGGHELNPA